MYNVRFVNFLAFLRNSLYDYNDGCQGYEVFTHEKCKNRFMKLAHSTNLPLNWLSRHTARGDLGKQWCNVNTGSMGDTDPGRGCPPTLPSDVERTGNNINNNNNQSAGRGVAPHAEQNGGGELGRKQPTAEDIGDTASRTSEDSAESLSSMNSHVPWREGPKPQSKVQPSYRMVSISLTSLLRKLWCVRFWHYKHFIWGVILHLEIIGTFIISFLFSSFNLQSVMVLSFDN